MAILSRLAQGTLIFLGAFLLITMTHNLVEELPLFTDPKFVGFWDDVEAYHLKRDGRKTPAEMSRQYGMKPVIKYIMSPGLGAAYLPSERAGVLNVIIYSLSDDRGPRLLIFLPLGWGFMLTIMYIPMVVAAWQGQCFLSRLVCRRGKARVECEAYFTAINAPRFRSIAAVFGLTLLLCLCHALTRLTPELRQHGLTGFEMTGWLTVLAYFSGLWLQLLLYIVDLVFLAAGQAPHRTLWGELIAVVVMTPILVFVFQNSWLMTATYAIAALAGGFLAKRHALTRQAAVYRRCMVSP